MKNKLLCYFITLTVVLSLIGGTTAFADYCQEDFSLTNIGDAGVNNTNVVFNVTSPVLSSSNGTKLTVTYSWNDGAGRIIGVVSVDVTEKGKNVKSVTVNTPYIYGTGGDNKDYVLITLTFIYNDGTYDSETIRMDAPSPHI